MVFILRPKRKRCEDWYADSNNKGKLAGSYIGEITFEKEWLQPGDEEVVTVRFPPGESIKKYLNVGQKWWIHEGSRLVGEAEILEV